MKKLIALLLLFSICVAGGAYVVLKHISDNLPKLITLADYEPLMVTEVYDRNKTKIGEFCREKRTLVPYKKIPPLVINAFLAAEDAQFFEHKGVDYMALFRAVLANFRAGGKAQGASTITMQVARSLQLKREKTYTRKIQEILLSHRMENHLSKEDILYLYLNQIYFGQSAYGIQIAAENYFRKNVQDLTLPEVSILAGLPKAPSKFSPIKNPQRAKERQLYVLRRMTELGFISEQDANKAANETLKVYVKPDYAELAPYYLETVRQILINKLGEDTLIEKGLRVYTSLDLPKQLVANDKVKEGLRDVDKRQGFRGPKDHIENTSKVAEFLKETRNKILDEKTPYRLIDPKGVIADYGPLQMVTSEIVRNKKIEPTPKYIEKNDIVDAIVTKVDDTLGLVYVRFAEGQGMIDFETMKWARKPNPTVAAWADEIKKPSQALQVGDVIEVKVTTERMSGDFAKRLTKSKGKTNTPTTDINDISLYTKVYLEQEPLIEGALLSIDPNTADLLAMVGGYDFGRNEYNRTYQAARQTGSAFKALVYASALDKGYTAASRIVDSPIVREEQIPKTNEDDASGDTEETITRKWKPLNHSKTFGGDILFRNALIRSLNVPTVKILDDIGINWAAEYARRLGIFNNLNMDLTLGLGSSGITLYEMTKAFAVFDHAGKRVRPIMIRLVTDRNGKPLLENISLDARFEKQIDDQEKSIEEKRPSYLEKIAQETTLGFPKTMEDRKKIRTPKIFFEDPEQLISTQTAYLITSILKGVVEERGGTGGAARALGREVAGKTGSTNGYYDAWFIGYTPQIVTGVWVGFDQEKSIGRGEVGGRAALPIWLEYMKEAHHNLPELSFAVPSGIVFANIDNETGNLASAHSTQIVRQAFLEGTEPTQSSSTLSPEEDNNFYKQDLSE